MTYKAINATLQANLNKTDRFGGELMVVSGGKRTAPRLSVFLPRERDDDGMPVNDDMHGFKVVLGKTIRVESTWGIAQPFFTTKKATEQQVVDALVELFSRV